MGHERLCKGESPEQFEPINIKALCKEQAIHLIPHLSTSLQRIFLCRVTPWYLHPELSHCAEVVVYLINMMLCQAGISSCTTCQITFIFWCSASDPERSLTIKIYIPTSRLVSTVSADRGPWQKERWGFFFSLYHCRQRTDGDKRFHIETSQCDLLVGVKEGSQ